MASTRFLLLLIVGLFVWVHTVLAIDVTPEQAKVLQDKHSPLFETKFPLLPEGYYARLAETFPKLTKLEQANLLALEADCHTLHQQFSQELTEDQSADLSHLTLLWQSAVERSQSIRYAIDKLSSKDASGKAVKNDNATKKLLNSIAQIGGAAGSLLTGSPIGLMSGSVISDALSPSPTSPNQKPVTDADMVILAKAVEELQSELLEAYYEFHFQRESLTLAEKLYQRFRITFEQQRKALQALSETATGASPYFLPLLESFLTQQQQEIQLTKQAYVRTKQRLGLLTGNPAVEALEQRLSSLK
jgi:hypothetical protein